MDAERTVRAYLDAMERRDLAAAKSLIAPGFHMIFPGNKRFDSLEQLVDQNVWNDMGEFLAQRSAAMSVQGKRHQG